jgi:hypothetical protein
MSLRARIALKVTELTAMITFLERYLDCKQAEAQLESGIVYMLWDDDEPFLLADTRVEDVRSLLEEPRIVFKPGDSLDMDNDLSVLLARLAEDGVTDIQIQETVQGDRKLELHAPDDYKFVFIQHVPRSPEEIIAQYTKDGEMVEAAIAGLSETDLDLRRSPDEWSIRQIVHHLAESDSLFLMSIKCALAQSGSTFVRPPYDQDRWAKEFAYDKRPIEPSLALIKAVHWSISQLFEYIPDHWDRYVMLKFVGEEGEGRKRTVSQWLNIQVTHTADHCEEIRQIRQIHGR